MDCIIIHNSGKIELKRFSNPGYEIRGIRNHQGPMYDKVIFRLNQIGIPRRLGDDLILSFYVEDEGDETNPFPEAMTIEGRSS